MKSEKNVKGAAQPGPGKCLRAMRVSDFFEIRRDHLKMRLKLRYKAFAVLANLGMLDGYDIRLLFML